MAVRYIIGSAGSGKTEWLYREMLRLSEEYPDKAIYYLVPDQATLQAQRELVARQKKGCVLNIDILSFSRLKYRLSEELGDCFATVLDDIGKSMLLKKVLLEVDDKLELYGGKHRMPGFVSEMKSMISEFQRYLVDADKLKELSREQNDPMLAHKLADLSAILSHFREVLGTKFLTEEDVYSAMCGPVERSEKLKHSLIFMSGFTGFTPSQFQLLRSLMRVCDNLTVALTMDAELYGHTMNANSVFHITAKTIAGIGAIADEEGIPVEQAVLLPNRNGDSALDFLQNNLFRRNGRIYAGKVSNVMLHSEPNLTEEVRFLLTEIEGLVRSGRCRYKDIAVICGDVKQYSQLLEEMTEASGIPCFIDYKSDVMHDPLIDFIRSMLQVLISDFRMDHVVHYMKNRLSGFSFSDSCLFENYLLAKGIRGSSAYRRPFQYKYGTGHRDSLADVNRIRGCLEMDLIPLVEEFGKASCGQEFVRILYDYLLRHKCYTELKEMAETVEKVPSRSARRKALEYGRIYEVVMKMLDNLYELLGDVPMKLSEFAEILDAGFQELKVGMIPPEFDSVTVGDVKRSRLDGIRHLFLLGVNEGVIPGSGHGSDILTEKEREDLRDSRVVLSDLPKDSLSTEEFYIYLACAKPSESLTISYYRGGADGKETKPSYVIYRIMNLMPELMITNERSSDSLFRRVAADRGRRLYLQAVADGDKADVYGETARRWFESPDGIAYAPEEPEKLKNAQLPKAETETIPEELSAYLYGNCLRGSVTMLEKYAECALKSFFESGLALEERAEYTTGARELGTVMHDAISRYSEAVKNSGETFRLISDEQASELMDKVIDDILAEEKQEIFHSSKRNSYKAHVMRNTLQFMTAAIKKQLVAGKFEPTAFEKKFHYASEHMELNGIIDRIDTYDDGTNTYVKIVDYKSSKRDLDFAEVYNGSQAQLPVYMKQELREVGERAVPAAMFYSAMLNDYVEAPNSDEAMKLRVENVKPNGIALNSQTVITGLDNAFVTEDEKYVSSVTPISVKKKQYTNVVDREGFDAINDYAEKLMEKEAEEILKGNVRRNPVEGSCDRCSYRDLCADVRKDSSLYRAKGKMSQEEFLAAIRKEEDDGV